MHFFSLEIGDEIGKNKKNGAEFVENENRPNLKSKEFRGKKIYIEFCIYVQGDGWCCFDDCYDTLKGCHTLCPPQGKPPKKLTYLNP